MSAEQTVDDVEPPSQCIKLVIARFGDADIVSLDIPLNIIRANSCRPHKYLRYIAVYITGLFRGTVHPGSDEDSNLEVGTVYEFCTPPGVSPLRSPVDLEAFARRTSMATSTTAHSIFKEPIVERDLAYIFTGFSSVLCEAAHIFPHARGTEWLKMIVRDRQQEGDRTDDWLDADDMDIDDVRNGMMLNPTLHVAFDRHLLAVMVASYSPVSSSHALMYKDAESRSINR
ncbi:hypothetical protein DACRYDRAFT_102183 [Dacryopinax primogenitus]|uniref:HNH nuclease domain-containing protein n=1 Tax=Dacryopinax primogenitus (strain DJM 731) TaxID=1858805 RepID=M5FWS4_DACPD|nr:uncharacterized protein DACRYDRAFT_102183 [Dacryopinax primogenitus]EJT97896.1 hypothetical protein DACRYDRAFT_102183 [Dacryopinax primogenitus]